MKAKFYLFFIVLISLCNPIYAKDCQDLQAELDIQNVLLEYINCEVKEKEQGRPIFLVYRFKGTDALGAEYYLIEKFNINPIERKDGHPFWRSFTNLTRDRRLEILIGTEENLYDLTRDDWENIDYFYVQFKKYTDDI